MKENYYKQIEDYVVGRLHEKDLAAFEKEMQANPELSETVKKQRTEWEIQELMAENVLRKDIRSRFSNTTPPEKPPLKSNRNWWIGLAVLLLLSIAAFFFLKKTPKSKSKPLTEPKSAVKKAIPNAIEEKTPETLPVPNQEVKEEKSIKKPVRKTKPTPKPNSKNVPIAQTPQSNEMQQLALAQYDIPNGLSGVRGQNDDSALSLAKIAFSEKKYGTVINLLLKLPEEEGQEALSLRSHANFLAGLYDAAARDFSALERGGIYKRDAQWFGLLARMATIGANKTTIKSEVISIVQNKNHPYNQQATTLLKDLE